MISTERLRVIADQHMGQGGLFVYERETMTAAAEILLSAKMPYGMTVRYAVKANPHPEIIQHFNGLGLHFDASSPQESERLLGYGIEGEKISLCPQILQSSPTTQAVLDHKVLPVATSLKQIDTLHQLNKTSIAVRINPGKGSGHNNRTTVGGPVSSFGIWHEQLPEVLESVKQKGMSINRVHTHIGSGVDPSVWQDTIQRSLTVVKAVPTATTLDVGGGFKIARMPEDKPTDMMKVLEIFAHELRKFADKTGRGLRLEIEPGTWLVGNAGTLLARIEDIVSTPKYNFLRLNAGMNAILRPSIYGAQHPIEVLNDETIYQDYVVVGPCCESGDILTPASGNPEEVKPRMLKKAKIGDYVAIRGAGAYCASMAPVQYNDIPKATEIVV